MSRVFGLGLQGGSELDAGLVVAAAFADGLVDAVGVDGPVAPAVGEHAAVLEGELAQALLGIAAGVERVDLGGGGGVFVGDGLVGDAGVGECHAQAAMPEHGGDGLETHPAVDCLGRERVAELVRVDVSEAGGAAHAFDDPADVMTIESSAVMVQQVFINGWVRGGPVGKESLRVGVQRHVTVVVKFADRDPQPWRRVQGDDGVGGEVAELTDPHPGPGQQLDDEPIERRRDGGVAASRAACASSKNLGSGSSAMGTSIAKIGMRAGASAQSHSMIRSKKLRSIPSRWRIVFRAGGVPLTVRCAAKNSLKSSMWVRRTSVNPTRSGCAVDEIAGEAAQRVVGQINRAGRNDKAI